MTVDELVIRSEDGNLYSILPFQAEPERLEKLWNAVENNALLRSDFTKGDFDGFMSYVLSPGTVMSSVFEMDDEGEAETEVGVIYADEIIPQVGANGHFIFWDRRLAGRQRLLFTMIDEFMQDYDLHRVNFEVPVIGYAMLRRLYKMGIVPEGRLRERHLQDGEWLDTYVFGVLRSELTEEALRSGSIPRTEEEERWFGILEDDPQLKRYVLREKE